MIKVHPAYRSGAALFLALALTGGCADRIHLTKTHGRAYSEAFGRQTVNPNPRYTANGPDVTQGLDSQEAAAVSQTYRRSLGGREGGEVQAQPMVIMNPGAHAGAPYLPPPSVPNAQ